MTTTLISLVSIFFGIIGGNIAGIAFRRYSLGFIGNTIAGVFGSILFIKSFSHFGFDPFSIMKSESVSTVLLSINIFVSFLGGFLCAILLNRVKTKMNKKNRNKRYNNSY